MVVVENQKNQFRNMAKIRGEIQIQHVCCECGCMTVTSIASVRTTCRVQVECHTDDVTDVVVVEQYPDVGVA